MRAMKRLLTPLLLAALAASLSAATPIPDEVKTGGFAIGCQAWTFNPFSVFEAIEKTAQAGGKVIEFFPGLKLSPDDANLKFGHEPYREVIDGPGNQAKAGEVKRGGCA